MLVRNIGQLFTVEFRNHELLNVTWANELTERYRTVVSCTGQMPRRGSELKIGDLQHGRG